jgi:hypothetical protein
MTSRWTPVAFALVLAASVTVGGTGSALARTPFDGLWSVLIITEQGDACGSTYQYPIRIRNGLVRDAGDPPVALSGRVARNGSVRVTVGSGDRRAYGSGRLSRNFGSGTWRGHSATAQCSGRWQAQRR